MKRRICSNRIICFFLITLPIVTILFSSSCGEKEHIVSSEDSIYVFIDELMNSWYYWYSEVPEVDIFQYDEPADLLDALVFKPIDKWSFIDDTTSVNSFFDEGINFGFGFMVRFDGTANLRVIYVFESSQAYTDGMRKGNIINSIDGIAPKDYNDINILIDARPATLTFEFTDNDLINHTITLSKTEIAQNAVLCRKLFSHIPGKTIGYLAYNDFLGYGEEELEEAFQYFKNASINELIIDLRYNTGGYISLAKEMAEMIAPSSTVNHVFITYSHNDIVAPYYDTTYYFTENVLNLDLGRVFFITTQFTASASELVINSLEPYMNVYLSGSSTSGKPVGMYGFEFHEWYIFPVTVSLRNASGYGDFYDGLPVDFQVHEGLDKDWGDETDLNISEILDYLQNTHRKDITATEKASESDLLNKKFNLLKNYLILDR